MVQHREACEKTGPAGETGKEERKREQERDKHTAWTLMCLWDTNRKGWRDAVFFRKFTAFSSAGETLTTFSTA